jgi:hypothetical protein
MTSDPSQVIVGTEDYPFHSVHGVSVHHRDFPEVRAEGESPECAARRLAEMLARTLDSVPSDWRRDILIRAIEDVRAFASRDRLPSERRLSAQPCRAEDGRA